MNPLFQALAQTWPARAAKSLFEAAKRPGEVYAGRADPMDVEKATDLAGLAMTGGLGGLGGRAAGEAVVGSGPIRAYHGSPHDFDRFDLSKIGTGEGAQAYGHGLYFAENEGVARSYRDALTGTVPGSTKESWTTYLLKNSGDDPAKAAAKADQMARAAASDDAHEQWKRVAEGLRSPDFKAPPPGRMYEVAIHADPERFLDWDAPLKGQPESVKPILEKVRNDALAANNPYVPTEISHLSDIITYGKAATGARTEDALREAGIPGIKYLDQGSRTAGSGSRNYVVFDDKLVEILKKYGLGGLAIGGLGGLGGMPEMSPRT